MAAQAIAPVSVKVTFERFLQDRVEEMGITWDDFAQRTNMGRYRLTQISRSPRIAAIEEVLSIAEALSLSWWNDLVAKWALGVDRITLAEASEAAMVLGGRLDLEPHVA